MHVFCITNGGMDVASARERILRYERDLAAAGIGLDVHVAGQVIPGLRGKVRYWTDLVRRVRRSDGVLIHRVPLGRMERLVLRACAKPILFDVDDAIWYSMEPRLGGLPGRSPRQASLLATIRLARLIRAGNEELARFLRRFGLPVRVAPTCCPASGPESGARSGPLTIGWIGHSSNLPYLSLCGPALRRLVRERPETKVRIVADRPADLKGLPVDFVPWSLAGEEELIRSFDVGIMPLRDGPWTRGKCGYKLLLYMAHGRPVVASPVGVNREIVMEGENGFLARTEEEWFEHLRRLVDDAALRTRMGALGRAFVKGRFDYQTGLRTLIEDLHRAFRPRRERRRVAMLLFHHPPMGGSASYRNARMARHLSERGWEPVVIRASRWPSYFRDPTIAHAGRSAGAPALDPAAVSRRLAFPDRAWPWALAALPAALRAARGAAAILSTSPPESAHLLAWLVKRLTGCPWIADHSNEWTDNPARTDSPARLELHRRLERFVMRSADRITTLSPHHTRLLQASYPDPDRISTLWTGWDPSEAQPPEIKPSGGRAVVLFAGMFYGIQRPDPFLDAAERAGLRDVEFHMLGDAWDSADRLRRSTIPCRSLGRVTRAEALRRMRDADFLLLTLTERAPGVVPGKMFEYASAGRPILAVVPPDGEVARWVRETRTGFVVPSAPVEEAASALRELFERWRGGGLTFAPDCAALARTSGAAVGERLDSILREVAGASR